MERLFLIHFHTFKNAGTSLDRLFRNHFGARWIEEEFQGQHDGSSSERLQEWVKEHAEGYDLLSTHTGLPPVPVCEGLRCAGVMMLRYPLDRIRSAYQFEARQEADTFGAKLAKETDFRGYVKHRLDHRGDFALEDFQSRRLFNRVPPEAWHLEGIDEGFLASRSMFLGLVEDFDESVRRLKVWVGESHPDFEVSEVRENVSRTERTLEEKVEEMREELGEGLFQRLCEVNRRDFRLFAELALAYNRPDLAEYAVAPAP